MNRIILLITFLLGSHNAISQSQGVKSTEPVDSANYVTFITEFDKMNETKDGYYLNGYVVEIAYQEA